MDIQCARFRGSNRAFFLDRKTYGGTLFEQYESVMAWLKNALERRAFIDERCRTDYEELPLAALRELVVNAICHRSYLYAGASIQISLFDDRLEIQSPGSLPHAVSLEALKNGVSLFRNPAIASVLAYAGLIEHWDTSIPRTFELMRIWHLPPPRIEDLGTAIKITLWRPDAGWPAAGAERSIVAYLRGETVPSQESREGFQSASQVSRVTEDQAIVRDVLAGLGSVTDDAACEPQKAMSITSEGTERTPRVGLSHEGS